MKPTHLLTILLIGFLSGCVSAKFESHYPNISTLTFCDILSKQSTHASRVVRVEATYRSAFEISAIGDAQCPEAAWAKFDPEIRTHSSKSAFRRFEASLGKNESIRVVVVGYLDPPNKPFEFKSKKFRLGFGHLNSYDYQFHILAVEQIL